MELNQKKKIEEEINFKELLKSPIRLFGWVFVYFFLILLVLGIFFGYKLIPISFNIQSVGIIDSTIIKKEIPESKGGIIPAVDLSSVKTPGTEMIAKGKELFDANCQSCHGANGMGDGPAGIALNPKPRNFHTADGWTNGRTIDALYKTLQEGILARGMAAYEYLPPQDRFNIINYIRTFSEFPPITDEQINSLDNTYNLSAGINKPNTIPVYKAITKLEEDSYNLQTVIFNLKLKILQDSKTDGAKLLTKYSTDLNRVLLSFISMRDKSFNDYLVSLINTPLTFGYRATILQLSSTEIKTIYDYLNTILVNI
ncbi:MAG: cytochrome c [Bacteroidota bacterium]